MSDSAVRHFTATFRTAGHAREFQENAERVAGATNITRNGSAVEFDAPTVDDMGYGLIPDIRLSVGYYGGPGTKVNGTTVPHEHH